jgi:hypothetical protein
MSTTHQKSSTLTFPLTIIATAMLVIGVTAAFYPQFLQQNLPTDAQQYFSDHSWLAMTLCIIGLALHVIIMMHKLKSSGTTVIKSFADKDEPVPASVMSITSRTAQPARARTRSFNAVKLKSKNSHTMTVNISRRSMFLLSCLFLAGVIAGSSVLIELMRTQTVDALMIPRVISASFFAIAAISLYNLAQPMVFDRERGYFWHGFKDKVAPTQIIRGAKPISRIHALQILRESNKRKPTAYELNLVLTDGSRINLMEHGCLDTLTGDADQLAGFLDVPVMS